MTAAFTRRLVAMALFTASVCFAQKAVPEPNGDVAPPKFYHLDLVVREVDEGKVLNTRSYATSLLGTPGSGRPSIRTGSKVPVSNGSYIDLGVSFDMKFLADTRNSLALEVSADISSIPTDNPPPNGAPVIRQNRWSSPVIVALGKPTIIFSSDDLTSKRKMQIELTATAIAP